MAALCKLEEIAESFAPYIAELHDFFRSRGVAFGCAEDVEPVVERLEADADFRDEMSSMVRAIMYRQRDGLERGELFELVLAAVGGAAMEERRAEFDEAVGRLRAFVNGVFRSRWSAAVEDRRGTELHGAMLRAPKEERQWPLEGPPLEQEREPKREWKQRRVVDEAVAIVESGELERKAVAEEPRAAAPAHSSTTLFYRARVAAGGGNGAEWPLEDELVASEAAVVGEEEMVATVEGAEIVQASEASEANESPVIADEAVEVKAVEPEVVGETPMEVEPEVVASSPVAEELGAAVKPEIVKVEAEVVAVEAHEVAEPAVAAESPGATEPEVVAAAAMVEEPSAARPQAVERETPVKVEAAASSPTPPWRAAAVPVRPAAVPVMPAAARARSQMKAAHAHEFSWFEPIEPRRRSAGWLWVAGICAVAAAVMLFVGAARRGLTLARTTQVQSVHPAKAHAGAAGVAAGQTKPSPGVRNLSDAQVAAMIAQAEKRGRESAGSDERGDVDQDEAELVKESEALAAVHPSRVRRVRAAAAAGMVSGTAASVGTQPAAPVVRPSQPAAASGVPRTAAATAPVSGPPVAVRVPRYTVPPAVMAGRLMYAPKPKYPALAKLMRVEGRVVVAEVVARDGQVMEAKVLSGHKLLRGSALRAVYERRYRPYMLDDRAAEAVTTAVVDFRLGR